MNQTIQSNNIRLCFEFHLLESRIEMYIFELKRISKTVRTPNFSFHWNLDSFDVFTFKLLDLDEEKI